MSSNGRRGGASMRCWRTMFRIVPVVTVLSLLILALALPAEAQILYGAVVGTAEDQSRAVMPGVVVTLANGLTGQRREVITDERGNYSFFDVQAGTYNVTATISGFKTFVKSNVEVLIGATVRVDPRMELGQTTESITVAGVSVALQTDRADVRTDFAGRKLTDLPIGGTRNFQSLLTLVPGAAPPVSSGSLAGNPAQSLVTNVNGASNSGNNTRVDGISANAIYGPLLLAYVPPIEAIASVNVSSNSYDAEQGMAGGSVVSVDLKSGTNEFHGSGFEYHTNNSASFNARSYFLAASERIPKFIRNQFGGTLGGPIVRDRLFFFGSFDGLRQRQNGTSYTTIPGMDQRQGDFSACGTTLYDPLTGNADGSKRQPFSGAIIPASRIEPISLEILSLLPTPNGSGTTRNHFVSESGLFDRDNYDAKINWNVSNKSSLFGRYSQMNYSMEDPHVLGKAGGSGVMGVFPGEDEGTVRSATIGGTHTFAPTFLVDGHVGYTRQVQLGHDSFYGTNVGLDVLGIPGTNGSDVRESGFPGIAISGYTGLGNSIASSPRFRWDNHFQYAASASWIRGSHSLRWGFELSRQDMNRYQPATGYTVRGGFTFGTGPTAVKGGAASNQFNSMGAFLLGLPTAFGKATQTLTPMTSRLWEDGLYIRDQWTISRNLTLNLGLRWEYYPMMTRDHRGLERYDPETNTVLVGGVGDVPDDTGVEVSKRLFGPRFGLAYRLRSRTVLRAGYGISTDPYPMAPALILAYPMVISSTYSGANTYQAAGRLSDGIPAQGEFDWGNGVISLPSTMNDTTVEKTFRRGYLHSFNLTVQRELASGLTAQVGYVGSIGIRQTALVNINAASEGTGRAGQPLYQRFGRTATTYVHSPRFSSNYHSMQAKLERQFASGWMTQVTYTFSKAIGYADDSTDGLFFNTSSALKRNRAIAASDRPHNLQAAFVVELPFGKGKRWLHSGRLVEILASRWQVNGMFSSYSGNPFTVTTSGMSLNATGNSQTADQVKPEVKILGNVGPGTSYFDPFAFKAVTEARFGTAGLYSMRGPGVIDLDASIFRDFRPIERLTIQFRAESSNVANTPHFGNPGTSVSNMTLNADGSVRDLNGYTSITSASGARQLRFAMRMSF